MVGFFVFEGAVPAGTTPDWAETAGFDPEPFVAVTVTRRVAPASAALTL
jgi:hypothetical protein